MASSYNRQIADAEQLQRTVASISDTTGAESSLIQAFCDAIGWHETNPNISPTISGVILALRHELVHPLRALNEGRQSMEKTFAGNPVPRSAIDHTVTDVIRAVLEGNFKEWRYTNPTGQKQLEGLTDKQKDLWMATTKIFHPGPRVKTIEGDDSELSFFWATKIGGPSHGFDIEGQCLLPLLANARSKVILVEDHEWSHNPAGRAHFKLVFARREGEDVPVLWLETVNCDFACAQAGRDRTGEWLPAVVKHAVQKARLMGVMLSVEQHWMHFLHEATDGDGERIETLTDVIVLRPSNGVVEASDYLSGKHDWVQTEEELTNPLTRATYTPPDDKEGTPRFRTDL
mmetsp:Transcript_24124/g.47278  ORF Transcript_24124/g.47278 Transcript_24124/m.47278 type:complete len:345 (-) Transcript_24124:117-1151(-)